MQVTALTYAKKDIKDRNLAPWQKTTISKGVGSGSEGSN